MSIFQSPTILYRTRVKQLDYIISKVVCVIIIGAGIFHFNENPVLITILIIVLLCVILFYNEEELIVYDSKFAYRSAFSLPNSSGKVYQFKDLKKVVYPVEYVVDSLPKKQLYRNNMDPRDKIHIIYKNGNEELLLVDWRIGPRRMTAVNKINEQLLFVTFPG